VSVFEDELFPSLTLYFLALLPDLLLLFLMNHAYIHDIDTDNPSEMRVVEDWTWLSFAWRIGLISRRTTAINTAMNTRSVTGTMMAALELDTNREDFSEKEPQASA
jgi:hypothetical protein